MPFGSLNVPIGLSDQLSKYFSKTFSHQSSIKSIDYKVFRKSQKIGIVIAVEYEAKVNWLRLCSKN